MRWEGRRQSEHIEDRRQLSTPTMVGGGLLTLLLMLGLMFLGVDPMQVAGLAPEMMAPAQAPVSPAQKAKSDNLAKFVRVVLADNEDVWSKLFPPAFGKRYTLPNLVLFTGQVQSACGRAATEHT